MIDSYMTILKLNQTQVCIFDLFNMFMTYGVDNKYIFLRNCTLHELHMESGIGIFLRKPIPMPIFAAVPVLPFQDGDATLSFYSALGFDCNANWQDYIMMKRDNIELHFWKCNDRHIAENSGCYLRVTAIESLYKECQTLGIVHPNGPLKDQPWNMREFSILDNNGNCLRIGERLA